MKTKKDIVKWWEKLGQKINHNDWENFKKEIEIDYIIEHDSNNGNNAHKIKIVSSRWKWPLKLYFFKNECYRIVGF